MRALTLTDVTAILGALLGTAGFVLGILNYLRDRPRVAVLLQWNVLAVSDVRATDSSEECGLITVTNLGRRPVFISHVCLRLPKHCTDRLLLLRNSISGQRLSEGDSPATFVVPHEVLDKYSTHLEHIRAQVSDSTGRVYLSKRATAKMPSCVKVT